MANRTRSAGQNEDRPVGPSEAFRAWVEFAKELCDWLIEARRRWHEGDPPQASRVRLLSAWAMAAVAAAAVLERLLGG